MPDNAPPGAISVTRPEAVVGAAREPARRSRAERDRALFTHYRDPRGHASRDTVVERFLPLARQIAARYQRPEEPFDDLFQVACLGLVKAVDRFDPARGIAFSSYAVPTIAGEIKRHFRDQAWAVRVPRDLQDMSLRVEHVVDDLSRERGHRPSVDDVAQAIGIEAEDVLEAMQATNAYRTTSLATPCPGADGDTAMTLGDTIGCVEDGFDRAEQRALLSELMRSLTLRERNVIRLRFEHDLTRPKIAERIGVSQTHVSRILRQSIARLRAIADGPGRSRTWSRGLPP